MEQDENLSPWELVARKAGALGVRLEVMTAERDNLLAEVARLRRVCGEA